MMHTLIIYDSAFGNTRHIAEAIAQTLEKQGTVRLVSVPDVDEIELTGLDLLILGCPTQGHGLTPAVRTLLDGIPRGSLEGLAALAFDTRYRMSEWLSGSAAHRIARKLQKAGARLILPAESFFVVSREGPLEEGELERAGQWAEKAVEQFVSA